MINKFRATSLLLLAFTSFAIVGFKTHSSVLANNSVLGNNCDSFEVKVSVNDNRKVEVTVQNGTAPYTYLFYDNNQKALNKDVNISSIEIFSSGVYKVMVLDSKGCSQEKEFTIF